MREYIAKRLVEIPDIGEREQLRSVLEEVFLPLYDVVTEKYQRLETRIYSELDFSPISFSIRTTLVQRTQANKSPWLFPMCQSDLHKQRWSTDAIQNALEVDSEIVWDTLYMEEDYLVCRKLENSGQSYPAILIIGDKKTPVRVRLCPAQRYRTSIVRLYHLFQSNGVPWVTPLLPYCYKFFDIVLADKSILADLPADVSVGLEYDPSVFPHKCRNDRIPIWNLYHIDVDQEIFPLPAMDKKNYEYRYVLPEPRDGYLVYQDNPQILTARREKDDLIAVSPLKNGLQWSVLQLMQREASDTEHFDHPIFSNRQMDSFAGRMGLHYGAVVKTKGELQRLLRSFEASQYMRFDSVQITDGFTSGETYDINTFLKDELRDRKNLKTMILRFVPAKKGHFLNRDILSFLVSQVQLAFPEYNCVGVFV